MPFEQMPGAVIMPQPPTEDEIRDRALATIRSAEDPRGPRLERGNLENVIRGLQRVIAEKRGEAGADREDIASYYKGYGADDLEELVSLLNERLVQLESDIEADDKPAL